MSAHALYSPSQAYRFLACPGSIRKESNYPEQTTNAAAIDGTHSHTLLSHCVKNGIWDARTLIDNAIIDNYGKFIVEADRAIRVNVALEYVKSRMSQHNKLEVFSEDRVHFDRYLPKNKHFDIWGTCDLQLIGPGHHEVIDYKDGFSPVDPDAPQLKLYALGSVAEHCPSDRPPSTVVQTVIQPKLWESRGVSPVTALSLEFAALLEWWNETLLPGIQATLDPTAPLIAGPHCQYCKHGKHCVERTKDNLKKCTILFDRGNIVDQAIELDTRHLTDKQLSEVVNATPLIRAFLNDVEALSKQRWHQGNPIQGTKAIKGKGKKVWAVDDATVEKTLKSMGIPKQAIYPSKLISPAQALKMTWKKRNSDNVQSLSARQYGKLTKNLIAYVAGGVQIVSDSDSREALPNPVDIFKKPASQPSWLQEKR